MPPTKLDIGEALSKSFTPFYFNRLLLFVLSDVLGEAETQTLLMFPLFRAGGAKPIL